MRAFVKDISSYTKSINPNFLIIPQNGIELAFKEMDLSNGFDENYLQAIDGIGVEEVFYNDTYQPDDERITQLKTLKSKKKIFDSEYIGSIIPLSTAFTTSNSYGLTPFIRTSNNYYYTLIPDTIPNENKNDIISIDSVKNYLYLIDYEKYNSKQDLISSLSATNFDLLLIDLFFNDEKLTKTDLEQLKIKANGGKRLVISYLNIGSAENYRYYWKKHWGQHHPLWIKRKYEGYPDEFWVKFWEKEWQDIIYGNDNSYAKMILDAGFDGAYLDNIEAYYFLYFKK